jgi:quercetin dioxygenase-like cupin family protein
VTRIATLMAALAVGCGGATVPAGPGLGSPAADGPGAQPAAAEPGASTDAVDPKEAEQVAAIEYAVNQTAGAVHVCYKRATAGDFRVDGVLVLGVEHAGAGVAPRVWVEDDGPRSPRLATCAVEVMKALRWPPVFEAGQQILIPLSFVSASAQYTVARADAQPLAVGQGLTATIMLDERSTGNPAAAMTWLELGPGRDVPLHRHDAAELLYFVDGGGVLYGGRGKRRGTRVAAGYAVYIPAGLAHGFGAGDAGATALQAYAPGGPEQRFERADAPGTELVTGAVRTAAPPVRRVADVEPLAIAGGEGSVAILFEPQTAGDPAAYLGVLTAKPEMRVPEHDHAAETELLYILQGEATMTVAGVDELVGPGTAIQIPPGVRHSALVTSREPMVAVQLYTPAGPEQRFKKLAVPK